MSRVSYYIIFLTEERDTRQKLMRIMIEMDRNLCDLVRL